MENRHKIFSRDPSSLSQYVYKRVELTTTDGKSHEGWVYTVDPVSMSFVLLEISDDNPHQPSLENLTVVLGHSVDSVLTFDEAPESLRHYMDRLFKHSADSDSSGSKRTEAKCERVKNWLEQNRIPVERWSDDERVLTVNNVVFIHPPYEPENCVSTNEIILLRIQKLLSSQTNSSVTDSLNDS